jgi:FAD-linked oxidoreductase
MTGLTRRELLYGSFLAATTGLIPGCRPTSLEPTPEQLPAYVPGEALPWRNWAGNQGCRPTLRSAPESEAELADLLRQGSGPIRPVGAGHSFSPLVPSDGTLVACDLIHGVVRAEPSRFEAEVFAGTRLHELGPLLEARGQAMPNLPDIDYQALGGAVATSTHGTGRDFGSLSSYVNALALVGPHGDVIECDRERNAELFYAARCSLGALGVVSRITLQNQAAFHLTEVTTFEPLGDVLEDIADRRARHRHFEFHAFPHTEIAMVVETDEGRHESSPPMEFEGDPLQALRDIYDLVGGFPLLGSRLYESQVSALAETPPSVRSGISHQILTHQRITRFREMEYTVPAEVGPDCLREILETIRAQAIPVVFPIEYRYIRADDVWLSMFHEQDGCSISIHQFADLDYRPYFDVIEPIFWKHGGRPHWGKVHSLTADELQTLYPRWKDFLAVREGMDPTGRMLNPHLASVFGLES